MFELGVVKRNIQRADRVAVERLAQLQDGRVLAAPTGDQLKVFTGGSWST